MVAEVRREEILDAAEACLREQGYHRTTVDDIAARAGLSKGAIYWHFKGKGEVFVGLIDRHLQSFRMVRQVAERAPSARDALHQMVRVAQENLGDTMQIAPMDLAELSLEYLSHASRDPELRERFLKMYREIVEVISQQIERGIQDGQFRKVDPTTVAVSILAILDGLMLQRALAPELDLLGLWEESVELLLRGIAK